ncbi:pentatricopeptide repeat-containing protein At3g21470 [Magnolia sinica]|uniref:pentatricopeptide repeat-containing protein At3g21470 n=1 Tax=Magnolia sinica TaxID=86752 RepID=UPI002658CE9B|nr:pentatricopeptide repeat-containing protein At3g21470 [Magnolia sinica]
MYKTHVKNTSPPHYNHYLQTPPSESQTSSNPKLLKQLHGISLTRGTQNLSLWSQLVKGYLSQGSPKEALLIYTQTRCIRIPHAVLPLALKACATLSSHLHGRSLHAESIKAGVVSHVMVGTSLVSMYSKCGDVTGARRMFDEMPDRNVITWNAMIGGYSTNGDMGSASFLFERMSERTPVTWAEVIDGFARSGDTAAARQLFDRAPLEMRNVVTWTVMVNGYASNGEMEAARQVFEEMPQRNFFAWSSMIAGYCKKGDVEEARKVFDRIPSRNLVNWNALIAGYSQNGFCEEALTAFEKMQAEGFQPDEVTVANALSACAQLGLLGTGKQIHELINRNRIKLNQFVLNGLVDMYAKCGDVSRARQIFDGMKQRNEVCWNAMITGLAIHGCSKEALELFDRMESSGEKPNETTFLAVLSACAHGGFVEEGLEFFTEMKGKYGLVPGIKHYGCLVDLLGRAGRLNEAYDLIKTMPMKPNDAVWGALLGACRIHADMEMAEWVLQEVGMPHSNKESVDNAHYVLLSNIYAASDQWEQAEKIRTMMVKNRVQKTPGCSSIMVGRAEHQFHAGAQADSRIYQLYGGV